MSEPFEDGETVAFGTVVCSWRIRQWSTSDEHISYDWIADSAAGDYTESDELFDSIEEAKRNLGVD